MADLPTRLVSADTLRGFVAAIFRKCGCDAAEAERIGLYLVNANLTGHDSHGVIRVPRVLPHPQMFPRRRVLPHQDVPVAS
jgi:LDH2 family malate/lactate/ureidoglycolate dehydrogenase